MDALGAAAGGAEAEDPLAVEPPSLAKAGKEILYNCDPSDAPAVSRELQRLTKELRAEYAKVIRLVADITPETVEATTDLTTGLPRGTQEGLLRATALIENINELLTLSRDEEARHRLSRALASVSASLRGAQAALGD